MTLSYWHTWGGGGGQMGLSPQRSKLKNNSMIRRVHADKTKHISYVPRIFSIGNVIKRLIVHQIAGNRV